MALDKIAFLPFGLMVDRWRWDVFSRARRRRRNTTTPGRPTCCAIRVWSRRARARTNAFDPGAKYHVPGNVPYTRYFLAHIYQFQFHRAACEIRPAGTGRCTAARSTGTRKWAERFNAMMEMGMSRPWPEAMQAFTGEPENDATAVAQYFAPLDAWLTEQNRGQDCGWEA